MTRPVVAGILVAALAAATAAAQEPLQDLSTRLHQAWLREALDLDTAAAARAYEAIADEHRTARPSYWIAVARLAELQRLGIPVTTKGNTDEAPFESLRNAMRSEPSPTSLRPVLAELAATPDVAVAKIAARTLVVPDMRPFTHLALEWARTRIDPSQLQWLQRMRQRDRTPPQANAQANERLNALDVMRAESQGKREQADTLRGIYFPNWKAPTWRADTTTVLTRVRERLDAWTADPETSTPQKTVLKSLREAFDQRAEKDPEDALTFLARLPVYADRLLPDTMPEPPKPDAERAPRPANR